MSKAKAPRVFVPLTKVDEEQRLVYGRITQEMLDKSGEVMDYATSKPFFEKWSSDIEAASGGLSKGNVRVMHGLTAAGKLTELDFDDEDMSIDVCSKIVDDAEWNKVVEGVYTGFSVGGKYEKRWTETIDGVKVKKFTANPNEVSIVDNPCVPSACFSYFKADGAEEQVEFQVENDDDLWPGFAKADDAEEATEEKPAKKADAKKKAPAKKGAKKKEAKKAAEPEVTIPNEVLVKKAEELAKTADDGTTWQDHLDDAREELTKAATGEQETKDGDEPEGKEAAEEEEGEAAEGAEDSAADEDADDDSANKVTPAGVKQQWTASDGKAFDKKAEAEAHEGALAKGEPTEADKLRERMNKALTTEEETGLTVWDDFERLSKVVEVLETPHEEGQPVLQKGMYNTSCFARCLWDMGAVTRKVFKEYEAEGDDETDLTVFNDMKAAVESFSKAFVVYAKDQVDELIAQLEDGCCVDYYDYYYAAAKENGEDQLAKDVCTVLEERRDPSREVREEFFKLYTADEEVEEIDDEDLPPNLAKRFEAIEADRDSFKKLAEDAIAGIEELKKSVAEIGDKPAPRAPRNIALRDGDGGFFKGAETEEQKLAMLSDMVKSKGTEGVALDFIKLAQQNGQQLHLNR